VLLGSPTRKYLTATVPARLLLETAHLYLGRPMCGGYVLLREQLHRVEVTKQFAGEGGSRHWFTLGALQQLYTPA